MTSTNKASDSNEAFLNKLTGSEKVGVDKSGRLYVKRESTGFSSLFSSALQTDTDAQAIAYEYVAKVLKTGDVQAYEKILSILKKVNLLSATHTQLLQLQKQGYTADAAEAIVVLEMISHPKVAESVKEKLRPTLAKHGTAGTYFVKNLKGEVVGVFKPNDEEVYMPNNPRGHSVAYSQASTRLVRRGHEDGTGWLCETAAYAVGAQFGVPYTAKIMVPFPLHAKSGEFTMKEGSFQAFAKGDNLHEATYEDVNALPTDEVQKLGLFDILVENGDRNLGNILYDKDTKKMTPIDHGLAFLDISDWKEGQFISELATPFIGWPQAKEKWSESAKKLILDYPIDENCKKLKDLGLSASIVRAHRVRFLFVKEAVKQEISLYSMGTLCTGKRRLSWLDNQIVETLKELEGAKQEEEKMDEETLFLHAFQKRIEAELKKI